MNNSNSGGQKEEQGIPPQEEQIHSGWMKLSDRHAYRMFREGFIAGSQPSEKREGPVLKLKEFRDKLQSKIYTDEEEERSHTAKMWNTAIRSVIFQFDNVFKDESPSITRDGEREEGERKYMLSNIAKQSGISDEWLRVWEQVEIWYGDIKKRESGEKFLKRLQATYFISIAPSTPTIKQEEEQADKTDKY